jgi:hypothetical protein
MPHEWLSEHFVTSDEFSSPGKSHYRTSGFGLNPVSPSWEHETNLMLCALVVQYPLMARQPSSPGFTDERNNGIAQWADPVRYVSFSLLDAGNIRNLSFVVPSL